MPPRRRRPPRAGALSELPPLKILRSILLLQIAYYVVATILLGFSAVVFGQAFSINLIFDWQTVRRDSTLGWLIAIVWVLVSFITVIPILLLIARSKLVPDFAFTIHFLHLIITSLYTRSIPTNPLWWLLQMGSTALMISLGVWACRYREMQPISFPTLPMPGGSKNKKQTLANGHASGGGQAYEMVPQTGDEENQT